MPVIALILMTTLGVVAWLQRRRAPSGVAIGVSITAIGGALVVLSVALLEELAVTERTTLALTVIAYAVFALRWVADADEQVILELVATLAGTVAAALAIGLAPGAGDLLQAWALLPLIGLAAYAWMSLGRAGGQLALLALAAGGAFVAIPPFAGPWLTFLMAFALLALALVPELRHFALRRRIWLREPQRLLEPRRASALLDTLLLIGGILLGALALRAASHGVSPLTLFVGAIAIGTVANRRRWLGADALTLALTGAIGFCVWPAWFMDGPRAITFGLVVAAGYLVWLARFWTQQLLDGRPWTTTGRLIPVARQLGRLVALLAVVRAAWAAPLVVSGAAGFSIGGAATISAAVCALFALGVAVMIARDNDVQPTYFGAAASAALATSLIFSAGWIALVVGSATSVVVLLGLACGMLMISQLIRGVGPIGQRYGVLVCAGFAPTLLIWRLLLYSIDTQAIAATLMIATAAAVSIFAARRRPTPEQDVQPTRTAARLEPAPKPPRAKATQDALT